MKPFFLSLFLLFAKNYVCAQQAHLLVIKVGKRELFPTLLDTVVFKSRDGSIHKTMKNIKTDSGRFEVSLPQGYYDINLYSAGLKFRDSDCAVVCGKCENKVTLGCADLTANFFINSTIKIDPLYESNELLVADFCAAITEAEHNELKKIEECKVSFFVTKSKSVEHVTFSRILTKKERFIVLKGLSNLKKWIPAEGNGKKMDGVYSINLKSLI
jgi:hypothetical protein